MPTTFGEYYNTGTVALTASSVTVTGTGVTWSDVIQGDILEAQGRQATIDSVVGSIITLMLPWAGTTASGVAYVIRKDAKARFDPALTQAKLREFLDAISNATTLDLISLHGSDIASASTVNLETATGNVIDLTGTAAIDTVILAEGHQRLVRFADVMTLVHSSSLVLKNAENIVTAVGDYGRFVGYAGSVVRLEDHTPIGGNAARSSLAVNAGRLQYVSTTTLTLFPVTGSKMRFTTGLANLPDAGVSITNSGLSASTSYFVYAFNNAGTVALFISTSSPTLQNGFMARPSNPDYAFVGFAFTNGSSQFSTLNVLSYYHRRRKQTTVVTGNVSTTNVTATVVTAGAVASNWSDEAVEVWWVGEGSSDASFARVSVGIDGVTEHATGNYIRIIAGASTNVPMTVGGSAHTSGGAHTYAGVLARSSSTGTVVNLTNGTINIITMG